MPHILRNTARRTWCWRFPTTPWRKLENESVMLIGKNRKHKLVGHFPPTPADPILRLVFPREVKPTDKSVVFRLYLPGVDFPERELEFEVRDLMYHGKLE